MINKFLFSTLISTFVIGALNFQPAQAGWESTKRPKVLPSSILELNGVFKGAMKSGTKDVGTAYMAVYPILEKNQPSGRYNIFLLYNDRKTGQVFEAYKMGGYRLALLAVGTDSSGSYVEPKAKPVGVIELKQTSRGPVLTMNPTENRSNVLSTAFEFNKISDDLWIGPYLPVGAYKDGDSYISSSKSSSSSVSLRIEQSNIRLKGVFYTNFELTGLMVLREEEISDSLTEYSTSRISGLIVSLMDDDKETIVLARPQVDGSATAVQMLKGL